MRRRTRARELALQYLYCVDSSKIEPKLDAERFLRDQTADEQVRHFALDLIHGCETHTEIIDKTLRNFARGWEFERFAVVDRNVLRIGVYEILCREDIPPQVSINEAVDLAKRFGSEKSGSFVNGVLDAIRTENDRKPFTIESRGLGSRPAEPEGETDESTFDGGDFPPPRLG